MSAELDARRVAAATVLADYHRWALGDTIEGDWQTWAGRLAQHLLLVLDQINSEPSCEPAHECQAGARLAEIRAVFEVFDWDTDDRQYALEQIEQILMGGEQ
jgi:hypothetical protein